MGDRICSVVGCVKPMDTREMCLLHYARFRLGRDVLAPSKRDEWIIRFLRQVDDSSSPTGCWTWLGATDAKGYGSMGISGQTWAAHRLSYALHNSDLPPDAFICHHCDNPPCVNPAHIYAGTPADNVRDMVSRGRNVAHGGELCGKSRLTTATVQSVRADYATGTFRQVDLRDKYGISQPHISSIVRREVWKDA